MTDAEKLRRLSRMVKTITRYDGPGLGKSLDVDFDRIADRLEKYDKVLAVVEVADNWEKKS